ncbi:MAG: helix-turn-helix transcriptional regulator [Acidobacteriia bacterium]|nr:helix-turn-helix transcriptional regulator [Terriglobia bacterium]
MQRGFLGAVEAVYDAAASPAGWSRALVKIAAVTGAKAGILLFGSTIDDLAPLATFGLGQPTAPQVAGTLAAAFIAPLDASEVGALVSAKPRPASANGAGNHALEALGASGRVAESVGVSLLREEGAIAALWLFRRSGGPFDDAGLETLQAVVPHLSRTMAVHLRVERAERRAAEAADAFDRVALGAVLVDAQAKPILANRAAKRIAAQQDGFVIADDGLRGATPADTRILQAAIAEVARRGSGTGLGLRLPRVSSSRPYEVMAVPIGRGLRWPARRHRAAVVFISDSGIPHVSPTQLVHDLYALTAAETRLAILLLGGQSLPEAAVTLRIARNTAHTQLASIFRKTETSSQAELVRVLLRGPGAVRIPGDSSDSYPPVEG